MISTKMRNNYRGHTSVAAEHSSTIADFKRRDGFSSASRVFFSIVLSSGCMPYVAAKKVNDTPGIDFWRYCSVDTTHTRHARSFKLFARWRQALGNCIHSRTQTAARLSWSSVADLRNVDIFVFREKKCGQKQTGLLDPLFRYDINIDAKKFAIITFCAM